MPNPRRWIAPWSAPSASAIALLALLSCGGERGAAPAAAVGATASVPAASKAPPVQEAEPTQTGLFAREIAAGDYHTCARMSDRTVRCWGRNKEGQLGDGTRTDRASPVTIDGLGSAVALTLGATFSCALLEDRTVRCWGLGGMPGGGRAAVTKPTPISGLADATQIDAGGIVVCARLASGKVVCWGGESKARTVIDAGAVEVRAAEAHACARIGDGTVRCWGDAPWAGGTPTLAHPQMDSAPTQLATGDAVACVRTGDGVQCWGRNQQGELGRAPDMELHERPLLVTGTAGAAEVVAGEAHVCALLREGTVQCWGSNADGELGRGTRSATELPGPVPGLSGVAQLALGADHACARTGDGAVRCWGSNANGQLGDGTHDWRLAPTAVVW